ncbi:MAG: hypothetical protein RR365_01000 [Bacteroides sp.]
MNINNFVIDRPLRGVMLHASTGEALWSVNQIENPTLKVTAETADAVDALGTPIVSFDRAKNAEFSAESSLFDLGLMAAQSGSEKVTSSATLAVNTPCFEEVTYKDASTTITLKHTPDAVGADGIPFIYFLNGDDSFGTKYAYASAAAVGKFTFTGKTLTLPTDTFKAGDKFLVIYNYNADATDGAIGVTNTAKSFPKAGKFVLEVLGADVCNPSTLYHAYIIFPQAKLLSDFDVSFTTDSKHPFSLKAMQEYCDHEKKLFSVIIPEAE